MTTSDHIVRFLLDKGIDTAFILSGNASMYMTNSVNQKMRYICARNEATAPIMAKAWAKLRGKPGVVFITAGPGAINSIPGLAECWVDSVPIMVFSGQVPTTDMDIHCRTFGTAGVNILEIVRPMVKYAGGMYNAEGINRHLEWAFQKATTGRPGPVWLDVPLNIQSAEYLSSIQCGVEDFQLKPPAPTDLMPILTTLKQATRPLCIIGQGMHREQRKNFLDFATHWNLPFGLSRLALDYFPWSSPLNLGCLGIKGQPYSFQILQEADVILKRKVRHFKLEELFDDIYTSRDNLGGKGAVILRVLRKKHIPKSRALMVGDSYRFDYLSAKKIGVDALLIKSEYMKHPPRGRKIEKTINGLKDMDEIIS